MDDLGYVKLKRSESAIELITHPNEFALFSLIILRARRTPSITLGINEAFVGDPSASGLSRQSYRTALKNLEKWKFLTTRPTNKGTIVKIINTDIYDINTEDANQQPNHQSTINQPTANHQLTTNKNERIKECKNEINTPLPPEDENLFKKLNKKLPQCKDVLLSYQYPPWLDLCLWAEYASMRARIKKPLVTERTIRDRIASLKRWVDKGYTQEAVVSAAVNGCWQDFYEPKQQNQTFKQTQPQNVIHPKEFDFANQFKTAD